MFNLFKKKSEKDKLERKYDQLMKDWHRLSTIDRTASDKKYAEAQEVIKQIESLEN